MLSRSCFTWLASALLAIAQFSAQADEDLTALPLEQLVATDVQTASSISRQVSQSPSAVSIVTSQDIRAFGYRTLGDIINSMRGLYTSYDRQYTYMGGRGFGKAGDYPGRIMLLIDGYQANDNLYNAAYLGNDGLLDTELIERVEYVSGPGAVSYGNGAFYGIINVITKKGRDFSGAQLAADFTSFHGRKQRITYGDRLDNGADFLLSASQYRSGGRSLYFPAFDTPATHHGIAEGLDAERNRRYFFKGSFEHWVLESGYVSRDKEDPTASYGADFNAPPSETTDTNAFVNLQYDNALNDTLKWSWRSYYGQYQYRGRAVYAGEIFSEHQTGRWWGMESKLVNTAFLGHTIVLGGEYRNDYQQDFHLPGMDFQHDTQTISLYAQDEYQLRHNLALNLGLRFDNGSGHLHSISPRAAVIYQPIASTSVKASYATAFRRPNVYEKYYTDGSTQFANPELHNELVQARELVLEHRPIPNLRLLGSLFDYRTHRLIQTDANAGSWQFFNQPETRSQGGDIELEHHWDNGLLLRTSYARQHNRDSEGRQLVNSPRDLAKLNLSLPLSARHWLLGFEYIYIGKRQDENRQTLADYALLNLTVSNREWIRNATVSASIKNALDQRYSIAAPDYMAFSRLRQDGRTFWLQVTYDIQ